MINIAQALIWLLVGLVLTNVLKYFHLKVGIKKYTHHPATKSLSEDEIKKVTFLKSLPYTPAYYLTGWLISGLFYLQNYADNVRFVDALLIGVVWCGAVLLIEMYGWVVAKHKLNFTWKQMYMQSQPWVSLNYYSIIISPLIMAMIINFNKM